MLIKRCTLKVLHWSSIETRNSFMYKCATLLFIKLTPLTIQEAVKGPFFSTSVQSLYKFKQTMASWLDFAESLITVILILNPYL